MQDIEEYKNKLKDLIEQLIDLGNIEQAEKTILEYEEMVKEDIDIVSMKAVILIMKNEIAQAEKLLIKSLNRYGQDFELLFNLAYLYEVKENYQKCYYYYYKANEKCDNIEIKENIKITLNNLRNTYNVHEYLERKHVLMLAQIFPPMGGSGVQRTLKFAKYLREFNYEPVIITVGNTSFEYLKDKSLEKEIPENLEIIRFDENSKLNGAQVTNLLNKYEGLINDEKIILEYKNIITKLSEEGKEKELLNTLLIPDLSSFWAMDVLDRIDEYIDFTSIDIIYSTSGPYSDHIIGYFLKERINKPWICDFRDEWTNNPYADFDKSNLSYKIIRNMEINILNNCDKLITISNLAKQNYINDLKVQERKIQVITNGYDEDDFKNIELNRGNNSKFRIIHNGMLYMIRTPKTFLMAIKKLIDECKIDKNKIEIIFSYTEEKEKCLKYLAENNMDSIVKFKDYMDHEESIKLSMKSDMLLLIVGQGEKNKGVYTGKVFEYLRMNKPILALSPKHSVVEELLKETNSGENYEFEDVKGISNYIYKNYKEWEKNDNNQKNDNKSIEKYERKNLTNNLSNIFDQVLNEETNIKIFEDDKLAIKLNVEKMITQSNFDEADTIINEYIKVVKNDCEMYSIKAVSLIMQGRLNEAEVVLKEGLSINKDNFDLNYNMGYLYEQKEKFNHSVRYYKKAVDNCGDINLKFDICSVIEKISSEHNLDFVEDKKKIVFFVIENGDAFIGDIINELSDEYETKKIIVTNYEQIDEGMEWADICWFEWCDSLIVYGSKHRLAEEKRIICRIHGWEVYEEVIRNPDWRNVDDLIIVAPHIRRLFEENTKGLNKGSLRIHTVFCGINVNKYPLNIKEKGYNLGYLGYINFKKNIPLTLDIFKKLYDEDKRYKLYLAGKFNENRTLEYLKYFIKENNLGNNIFFEHWKSEQEKIEWFKKINYMIVSSIDEGLCFAAAEAMCSGIKPILHNCEGIKDHYDNKYIFNSSDEAVNMISEEKYNSKEYRNFIEENYSLKKEYYNIKSILDNIAENYNEETEMNEKKPLVTIGVLNFNYEQYLDKCITSILNQKYTNIEILIVDDYSTDYSIEMIKSYEKEHKNIRGIYHKQNSGGCILGLREIIEQASGEYCFFISSDDCLLQDNSIDIFVQELLSNSEVDYVFSNLVIIDKCDKATNIYKYDNYDKEQIVMSIFKNGGSSPITITGGMHRMSFFRSNNINWFEDEKNIVAGDTLNILINIKNYDWKYKYINENLICYRQHGKNMTFNLKQRVPSIISVLEYIINNFDENIYLAQYNFNKINNGNREALKYFLIGVSYYNLFEHYSSGNWKAWGVESLNVEENYIIDAVYPLIKVIKKYLIKSLEINEEYKGEIINIHSKIDMYLSEVKV
ncbi:glycosyltransferase [Clostridium sp. ZBS13]|uniref:glycosyltransferase n=1 Tax=Clostridium sp. ZBS13 TaxID=2949971 RepID=UPI00207ACDE8|nr:glycosyltransferase [Clostridium sp. ZBS13]